MLSGVLGGKTFSLHSTTSNETSNLSPDHLYMKCTQAYNRGSFYAGSFYALDFRLIYLRARRRNIGIPYHRVSDLRFTPYRDFLLGL